MNRITFGKDSYHLNGEMERWCRDHVGPGKWVGSWINDWTGMEPHVWAIESMFGNTTFMFKEDRHYHWFLLRWGA